MATFPRTSPLALAAALLLACTSNPTPHPGVEDTISQPDVYVPSDEAQRDVCSNLGGQWSDDDSLCEQVDSGFDSNAGAMDPAEGPPAADIVAVEVTGSAGAYDFTVVIASDDTGCDLYVDWWEIVEVSGTLVQREVQAGPHIDDQPFTDTATGVDVADDALLLVRAHLSSEGYVGIAWVGRVKDGFTAARVSESFAEALETAEPQPPACVE